MFARSVRLDYILSALFVVAAGACSGTSGCGACSATAPLPGGALPAGQTVEGGAQIRITQQGFSKLTEILPGAISSSLGGGFCIPKGSAVGVTYCDSTCSNGTNGCQVNVGLSQLSTTVTSGNDLNVHIDAHGTSHVPLDTFLGGCSIDVTVAHLVADADIAFGIDPTTGELTVHAASVNNLSFSGINFSGCSFIGSVLTDVVGFIGDILDSSIGQFAVQLLTPVIDNILQGLLPHPLGIAGMMDVGKLLQGVSPGTTAEMEARIVPGGYVSLNHGGMSLGVITGLNSDEDPTTRQAGLDSEPALCVPPIPAPDFAAPPASLPRSSRTTFQLAPAGAFAGGMDPAADLAMGISETTLDLAGHHMVTSGALCLGVGTSFVKQLNVGTIGILVPSLAALDKTGTAPLLLVTRPQRALDFSIGDNSATSPALTIGISHMEVDFYAFLYDRYVRAFTMDLSMNVGVGLDVEQQAGMPATITPTLSGISSSTVTVSVINSEFVKEDAASLSAILPSVFDLVTPLLGNIAPITVPSFAGFTLNNPTIGKVTTSQDDFLALTATLGTSPAFRELARTNSFAAEGVMKIDGPPRALALPSNGTARLVQVATPKPELVIAALKGRVGGVLPRVTFDVDAVDADGRDLEWSWNLNGGLWRPWTTGPELVISDRALAWQGKYTVGLKSRVKGDYMTVRTAPSVDVIIDSVAPTIDEAKITTTEGVMSVPMHDIVSEGHLQFAFAKPSAPEPATFTAGETATISASDAAGLTEAGELVLYVKDEVGIVEPFILSTPFHGTGTGAGCACGATGTPSTGGLLLVGLVGGIVLFPRRRGLGRSVVRGLGRAVRGARRTQQGRLAIGFASWLGLSTMMSLVPGCSCHKTEGATACETGDDCPADACGTGQLPFCIDGTCVCSDDIPAGRIGPYSAIATAPDGTAWVSAYAESHGDLVVASVQQGGRIEDTQWEWVDGIPDEPPTIAGSMIRGGIAGAGVDVGMYTSIQVAPDGTPMVTYFDVDHASLQFAAKVGGVWQKHTVDIGTGNVDGTGDSVVGMYTALTLRTDDGRPGVAYLAHVNDGTGVHAEVRFAAAQVPIPTQTSDWLFWVVDTAPVPAVGSGGDIYPLPGGLGLFVDVSRDPNTQAPVVAYYDRANGDLKVSKFDTNAGQFATPVVLAGTTDDSGWSPSVVVDAQSVIHVAYVDATKDDLTIITDQANASPTVIDDGYRVVGQSIDGLPKPTFDFVGDDAKLLNTPSGYYVAYQDATTQELLLAHQTADGTWSHVSIAGATDPWPGAYGFFASAAQTASEIVMSSWVIDQPTGENWVEVFRQAPLTQ